MDILLCFCPAPEIKRMRQAAKAAGVGLKAIEGITTRIRLYGRKHDSRGRSPFKENPSHLKKPGRFTSKLF